MVKLDRIENRFGIVDALVLKNPITSDLASLYSVFSKTAPDFLNRGLIPLEKIIKPIDIAQDMRKAYDGLGEDKWMECIDRGDQMHGRHAYDLGLHRGKVEPGYLASMEDVFAFLRANIRTPLTPEFYLEVHRRACAHFSRADAATFTHCPSGMIGKFRDKFNYVSCFPVTMTEEGQREFDSLGLGTVDSDGTMFYHCKSSEEVRALFTLFLEEYNMNIRCARNDDDKLRAIALFFQKCEWLHPVVDGCGRTDIAILNFLLVQNGFHPVILDQPYLSTRAGLTEWVAALKKGLANWEMERNKTHEQREEAQRQAKANYESLMGEKNSFLIYLNPITDIFQSQFPLILFLRK